VPQHAAAERPIALLRLDGDLYDSTMVPLEHLYRFVAVGGWVVIDDYFWERNGVKPCKAAVDLFRDRHAVPDVLHFDGVPKWQRTTAAGSGAVGTGRPATEQIHRIRLEGAEAGLSVTVA
jgi:hypothetical protein